MSERSVRSGSSLYFERYANAERQNVALGLTVYLLGSVCVILVAGLIFMAARPKPVHYVPGAVLGGISYPGRVPAVSALSFASAWLMNWSNYSPETAGIVHKRSLMVMAPSLLSRVRMGLDEELQKIARERISSVFTLREEPRVEEGVAGFRIIFTGERGVYVGKEEISREDVRFVVDVRQASPTADNPYGLVVFDIKKEKVGREML